ncbi:MAG: protein kinase [Planctomycetes bacterium]|nr:protein kinase [Planctomycetota bacterium]
MHSAHPSEPNLSATVKAPAPPDPWVGRALTKYAIVARLGRGGMGVVYLAEDRVLKRAVAVKLIAPSLTNEPKDLQRFLREARSAARLQHGNVVAIYDIDEDQGTHSLVMEFVPGPTAQQIIDRDGALPWRAAAQIVADACRGLMAAHGSHLIHRDVKPANLLISRTGEVKLSDFGLAKVVADEQSAITHASAVIGTPLYMSPEQARNEDLDERSDLYSLGATFYALLTGEPPFRGKDLYSTMYAHATKPMPDPRAKRPDIPAACVKIVERAMAKRRADRFGNAQAMLQELEALLGPQRESLSELAANHELPRFNEPSSLLTPDLRRTHHPFGRPWLVALVAGSLLSLVAILVCAGAAIQSWLRQTPDQVPTLDPVAQFKRDLLARNPDFDGKLENISVRDGKVRALNLSVVRITDITPVRDLTELDELDLHGKDERTPFADISPLANLKKIKRLRICFGQVKNIDALQNMKSLTDLHLGALKVDDLQALRGLPITHLRLGATYIRDLRGLENSPIEHLDAGFCYRLESLRGLPREKLRWLSIASTNVDSLRPLEAAEGLTYLDFHWAKLTLQQRKVVPKRSLDPDDMQVLLGLSRLKELIGEFTPAEAERLRNRHKGCILRSVPPSKLP